MIRIPTLATALLALATSVQAPPAQAPLAVGDTAPPLRCEDATGRTITWDDFRGRAVVLFFHSQHMSFSHKGLEAVTEALAAAGDLLPRAALLIATDGREDLEWVQQQIARSGLPGAAVVDPDRRTFAAFHVVAFPTICCLSPERRLAHVAKGYGPLLAPKAIAGARLAAGLIDQEGLQQALRHADPPTATEAELRVARSVRMAEKLFASGMLDEARATLEAVLRPGTNSAEGTALLARVLLAQGRGQEAGPVLQRLETLAPSTDELRELQAQQALQQGQAEQALQLLGGLDATIARIALIKGAALERLERYREAAEVYRRALVAAEPPR